LPTKEARVLRKPLSSWLPSKAALLLGGDGGREEVTPKKVRAAPAAAGTSQAAFIRGMSLAVRTSTGLSDWPMTKPTGLDKPRTAVAKGRCPSGNQCWLTLAGTLATKGLATPVTACPTRAIQY